MHTRSPQKIQRGGEGEHYRILTWSDATTARDRFDGRNAPTFRARGGRAHYTIDDDMYRARATPKRLTWSDPTTARERLEGRNAPT